MPFGKETMYKVKKKKVKQQQWLQTVQVGVLASIFQPTATHVIVVVITLLPSH